MNHYKLKMKRTISNASETTKFGIVLFVFSKSSKFSSLFQPTSPLLTPLQLHRLNSQ